VTAAPTITVSPASLPATSQNQAYSQRIPAAGGTAPHTFAVTAGTLPAGLTLASDGTLSGTPTTSGTFDFTVTATDANGYTAIQAVTLTVNAPLLAVAADPAPPIVVGGAFTPFIPVTASGGTAPYTYSISPGLPAGMTFDASTGRIAGTPTQGQPLATYTVTIQDASGASATKTFELQAQAYAISMTPDSADLGTAGLPVSLTFAAAGGAAPYVFALESGVLPGGLTLSPAGQLTGRATQAGTYPVQLRVTDANGAIAVTAVTFTVDEPRPDPTLDAGVQALQTAQADSIRRFGQAQTDNAVRRLEQLRGCSAPDNQLTVQVGDQGSVPVGQLAADAHKANCEQARSVWAAGTIVLTDGVGGGDSLTTDGITVGLDFRVNDTLTLGAGIGYSREGDSRLAGGAKLSGNGYNALAYGSWQPQPQFFVEGLVGFGSASYDISRLIAEDDVRATASRDASHWFGSLGIAGNVALANTFLQPYLRADYQAAGLDAYREHSVSSLALRYDSLDSDTMGYTGGVRANWSIATSFGSFDPMLRLEYRGLNRSSLNQHLEYADGLDETDYRLKNGSDSDTSGLVGAGFGLRFLNGFSAELEYQTTLGSDLPDEQSIGAIVNWAF
jgi:outer membrane autotransporter protein